VNEKGKMLPTPESNKSVYIKVW